MDIFILQLNYQSRYLVIIDDNVYFYKTEKCKVDLPFLSFQPKQIFIGKSKVCKMTEVSEAKDNLLYDGNTISLELEDIEYIYISGLEILKFKTEDKIVIYIPLMGNNMCPFAIVIGE